MRVADLEVVHGRCIRDAPDAIHHITYKLPCFVRLLFQAAYPIAQRVNIMLSEVFHVTYLKAVRLCNVEGCADRNNISIRVDIAANETWRGLDRSCRVNGDAVNKEDAAWTQQLPRLLEVSRQHSLAYLLNHAR